MSNANPQLKAKLEQVNLVTLHSLLLAEFPFFFFFPVVHSSCGRMFYWQMAMHLEIKATELI